MILEILGYEGVRLYQVAEEHEQQIMSVGRDTEGGFHFQKCTGMCCMGHFFTSFHKKTRNMGPVLCKSIPKGKGSFCQKFQDYF